MKLKNFMRFNSIFNFGNDLYKAKKVFVPQSPKHKAYWRFDPRTPEPDEYEVFSSQQIAQSLSEHSEFIVDVTRKTRWGTNLLRFSVSKSGNPNLPDKLYYSVQSLEKPGYSHVWDYTVNKQFDNEEQFLNALNRLIRKASKENVSRETLGEEMPEYGKDKHEIARVFDKDGKVAFEKEGENGSVDFTDDEAEHMRGMSLIHNHPSQTSFSRGDIEFGMKYGLSKMMVETKDGIYTITFPPDVKEWGKNDWGKWNELQQKNGDKLQDSWDYSDAEYDAENFVDWEYKKGKLKLEEAAKSIPHEIWKRFATIKGWKYEFTPKKAG